jgi:DNA modification methylase
MRAVRNMVEDEQALLFAEHRISRHRSRDSLLDELAAFRQFRTSTQVASFGDGQDAVPLFVNEFWTSKQRAASSLHEVSYRACFKPQLPRFFIERLTVAGDTIYDPFLGRGTTIIEAALLGRRVAGCDINPISSI